MMTHEGPRPPPHPRAQPRRARHGEPTERRRVVAALLDQDRRRERRDHAPRGVVTSLGDAQRGFPGRWRDIPLTIAEWDEWGDPRDPRIRAYMESYSPYDNPPRGPRPALLVTGSLHDPRVLIHEPAKWVARLRATSDGGTGDGGTSGRPLFRPELGSGAHVGPAGRYDRLHYEAEILAFIVDAAA